MCIVLDVKCARSKSKISHKKTSSKQKCSECVARKAAREEVNSMFPAMTTKSTAAWMSPALDPHEHRAVYNWEDWSASEDNYPAMASSKQWRNYMKMNSAYNLPHENGAKIGEAKPSIMNEIKETQKSIKDTQAGVTSTDSRVKETREAIELANAGIRNTNFAVNETHAALKKTQDAIRDNHAEYMTKQGACAADVAKVRQLLEDEAKQREETRRVQEMVRYAQSQGLLQTQAQALALAQVQAGRDRTSRDSSPDTAETLSSSSTHRPQETHRRRQWERERVKPESHHRSRYSEAMRGIADTRQRLQQEQERWSRAELELDWLRRRDMYYHSPRQGSYYEDIVDAPVYETDPYVGHHGDRASRVPRRAQPKCRQWDH